MSTCVNRGPSGHLPQIVFGTVHARITPRALGGGGVPAAGGWPLGLASPCSTGPDELHSPAVMDVALGTVDDFEEVKARELEAAAAAAVASGGGGAVASTSLRRATSKRRPVTTKQSRPRPLTESERRSMLVAQYGQHPLLPQRNLEVLQELEVIRTSRASVGCRCAT
jgi:hypothetical protein